MSFNLLIKMYDLTLPKRAYISCFILTTVSLFGLIVSQDTSLFLTKTCNGEEIYGIEKYLVEDLKMISMAECAAYCDNLGHQCVGIEVKDILSEEHTCNIIQSFVTSCMGNPNSLMQFIKVRV